jgi:hypothetical protein
MVLLGDEVQLDSPFGLFGDSASLDSCMVCAKCSIGLEIIFYAPDGTPRSRGTNECLFWSVWRLCYS